MDEKSMNEKSMNEQRPRKGEEEIFEEIKQALEENQP
jgi:hypothetical protein